MPLKCAQAIKWVSISVLPRPPLETEPVSISDTIPIYERAPVVAAMAPNRPAIAVEHLTKRFGKVLAVDDLSLQVFPKEIFGILGSNGAGKTTTLKVICGLLRPDGGRVEVAGIDVLGNPSEAKGKMGFLPEAPALYDQLTGKEFLEMIGTLRGIGPKRLDERIRQLLETLELTPSRDRNVGTYSRGMRQKLAYASAVIHEPGILVLDEPLSGLDPRFGKIIKAWIREHAESGGSVLMSTHITANAEQMCNKVAVMDRGRLLASGSIENVMAFAKAKSLEDAFVALVGGKRWPRSPSLPQTP
jgi:ABC-2 type transport system ATP-binding protein